MPFRNVAATREIAAVIAKYETETMRLRQTINIITVGHAMNGAVVNSCNCFLCSPVTIAYIFPSWYMQLPIKF